MTAHSACWCQWSSRTPPGPRRMLTPEIVVEILKSSWVICRAQPPFWIRLGARLNEAQNCGMPLTSVAGGLRKLGSWPASPGSCGPGSVNALGLVTLTAPSGGRSGLPKTPAAWAAVVIAANPPAASIARRERFAVIISLVLSTNSSKRCFWVSFMTRDYRFRFLTQSSKIILRIRNLPNYLLLVLRMEELSLYPKAYVGGALYPQPANQRHRGDSRLSSLPHGSNFHLQSNRRLKQRRDERGGVGKVSACT